MGGKIGMFLISWPGTACTTVSSSSISQDTDTVYGLEVPPVHPVLDISTEVPSCFTFEAGWKLLLWGCGAVGLWKVGGEGDNIGVR